MNLQKHLHKTEICKKKYGYLPKKFGYLQKKCYLCDTIPKHKIQ